MKKGIPFARDLSLEDSEDSYLCFLLALLYSVSYICFLYRSPSPCLYKVSDAIPSKIDKVLSINLSANVFACGDFNVHHKNLLTYSGGADRPGELCYNFLSQTDLLRRLTVLHGSLGMSLTVLFSLYFYFYALFFSSDSSICYAVAFPPLKNSDHLVASVSIDFPSKSKRDAPFHCKAYDYSRADWDDLPNY